MRDIDKEVKRMSRVPFRKSPLWNNIGEVAVQTGNFTLSVYQSALFTVFDAISPGTAFR